MKRCIVTYLISREYEGLVSYLLLFYHRSCLVSMCLSTELWTLSHQSCIANVHSKETFKFKLNKLPNFLTKT